jgi:RHS repeat-associated protein
MNRIYFGDNLEWLRNTKEFPDASGNRTAAGGVGYTPNNLNQYSNIGGGATVSNGGNGNLSSYNGWNYTYDSMNRLTNVSGPAGVYANFKYDGLGRQIAYNSSSAPNIISLWDGWNIAAAYIAGSSTAANRYIYAGNDLIRSPLPEQIYFYPDALGSTTHLADASGTLVERYTYDVYGAPTFYTGSGTVLPNGSAYGVDLLYTGQPWYSQLGGDQGLYDLRNRYYMPTIGRFLQPDPIGFDGDSANMYRYCGNNPANASDPEGLDAYYGFKIIGTTWAIPWNSSYASTAHQFVYTTNSDGTFAHTYSWGSNEGGLWHGVWLRDHPYANAAAQTLIRNGGGQQIGYNSSLDMFIDQAFQLQKGDPAHINGDVSIFAGVVRRDCQAESERLIQVATELQTQFLKSRYIGYDSIDHESVYSAPAVKGFDAKGAPIYAVPFVNTWNVDIAPAGMLGLPAPGVTATTTIIQP